MSNLLNTIVRSPSTHSPPKLTSPSCSLACFKLHKPTHETAEPAPSSTTTKPEPQLELPEPPPPAPPPKYLKQTVDYSIIATNPKFKGLLKTYPALLASLQRVYAATLEPDPEDQPRQQEGGFRGRGGYQGRGRGGRGRGAWGRGRGRGRGGFGADNGPRKWSEKQGDAAATKLLKRFREGKETEEAKVAMAEFVGFVEETLGGGGSDGAQEKGERMQMG